MSVWHGLFADLIRDRFPMLVAYGVLLTGDREAGRELAQSASATVFARRRMPAGVRAAEREIHHEMARVAQGQESAFKAASDHISIRVGLVELDPAIRAAAVLATIDGLSDEDIQGVLGRDARPVNEQLPDQWREAIDELYATEARIYATPSGGVSDVIATARRDRRGARLRFAAVAGVVVLGVGVLGYGLVNYGPEWASVGTADGPTTSASPSSSVLAVMWDPGITTADALAGFRYPECGAEFAPAAVSVGGVIPEVQDDGAYEDPVGGTVLSFTELYVTEPDGPAAVLSLPYMFVITLDDEVVLTPGNDFGPYLSLDLATTTGQSSQGGIGIGRGSFCDAREAYREAFEEVDWEELSPDEQEQRQIESDAWWEKWNKDHAQPPPGTYRVYIVTPIVLGEQALVGQALRDLGVDYLPNLEGNLAYTPLADDPRVVPYCTTVQQVDYEEEVCDPPADVLRDVLTMEIDAAKVVHAEPGIAISEPLVLEVPAA